MLRARPRAFFTRKSAGFTLIELMIVLAIIAILAAIAVPNYANYLKRGKLTEATAGLASRAAKLDQWYLDHLKYESTACDATTANKYFDFSCAVTDTTYILTATGKNSMADFVFTVDQANQKATTKVPDGWTKVDSCWVTNKAGVC